jgi:hypothetical protein
VPGNGQGGTRPLASFFVFSVWAYNRALMANSDMPATTPPTPATRLDSWKAIAAHFSRDVRTVRRWEKLERMPVHRHVHSKLGSVYAFEHELDAWSAARAKPLPADPPPTRARTIWRWVAVAAAAATLVVMVAAGFALWGSGSTARAAAPLAPPAIASRIFAAATGEGQAPRLINLGGWSISIAITPDGRELIALDRDNQAIQFVETASETVSRVLPLGAEPIAMTMSSEGDWIYVSRKAGDVVRVNRRTRAIDTIATGIREPASLALMSDGRRLYIAAVYQGLKVVDLRAGTVSDVPTVKCPVEVAAVPGRDLIYVGYQCGGPGGRPGHDAMDVRVASTGALIKTVVGPPQVSSEMAASPDGAQVWIDGHDACFAGGYDHADCPNVPGGVMHVYRAEDHLRLATFGMPLEEQPEGLAFLPDSSRAIVAGSYARVFDTRRMTMVERAAMATQGPMVFTADGGRAFALTDGRRKLAIFDLSANTCAPPPAGLVTWWPGDGHAGDVHAGNDGLLRGGAAFAPGFSGQAFAFDGVDDYIDVPLVGNFTQLGSTVALSIKPRGPNKDELLLDHVPGAYTGWRLRRLASGQIEFCLSLGGGPCSAAGKVTSRGAVPSGTWTDVVVVETSDTLSLYLNGALDASSRGAERPNRVRQALRIGAPFAGGGHFSGLMDEIRFFNTALGADEITRMRAAGRSGLCVR